MKSLTLGCVATAGLLAAAASGALAQSGPSVTGKGGDDRAMSIQVYGNLDLQWRYANNSAVAASGGAAVDTKGTLADGIQADAWLGGSAKMNLHVDANLAERAMLGLELATPRIDAGANVNTFGSMAADDGGIQLGVRQAFVKLEQLVSKDMNWTIGLQNLSFDLAGKGHPMIFGLRESGAESAWAESNGASGALGSFRDETRPGGVRMDWKSGTIDLSAFHMTVGDVGSVRSNEYITGVDLMYTVDNEQKTRIEATLALLSGTGGAGAGLLTAGTTGSATAGHDSEIWLIGVGAASSGDFVPGLDLAAQIYFNSGTYGRGNGGLAGGATRDIDASGEMFNLAADYHVDNPSLKPVLGFSYTFVSGNDPKPGAADTDYEAFVSYEDNDDLVILEDNEFGFDVDSNYRVIKLRGAISTDLMESTMPGSFTLETILGFAKLDEGIAKTSGGTTDDLGMELDLKATQMVTKQVAIYGAFAWLTGADAIEDAAGIGAPSSRAFTWFIGTDIKF